MAMQWMDACACCPLASTHVDSSPRPKACARPRVAEERLIWSRLRLGLWHGIGVVHVHVSAVVVEVPLLEMWKCQKASLQRVFPTASPLHCHHVAGAIDVLNQKVVVKQVAVVEVVIDIVIVLVVIVVVVLVVVI